jgi:hypothetical protein
MGPLFSLAIMGVGLTVAWFVAYVVARFFLSISLAARTAAVFVVATAVGGTAALVLSSFHVGTDANGVSGWRALAHLASLLLFGFASGAFAVRLYLAHVRSNKTMEPTR